MNEEFIVLVSFLQLIKILDVKALKIVILPSLTCTLIFLSYFYNVFCLNH